MNSKAPFDVDFAREMIRSTEHPDSEGEHLKKASVFMLMRTPETDPTILAILKANNKGYPWANQVAFPGGHQDPVDASPLSTAYRELEEETGILSDQVDLIGSLGHFQTIKSTEIEAFFGIWDGEEEEVVYDTTEIARIVMIPLGEVVKTHHEKAYSGRVPGWDELLYPVEDMAVWGATARIFHYFTELLLV